MIRFLLIAFAVVFLGYGFVYHTYVMFLLIFIFVGILSGGKFFLTKYSDKIDQFKNRM